MDDIGSVCPLKTRTCQTPRLKQVSFEGDLPCAAPNHIPQQAVYFIVGQKLVPTAVAMMTIDYMITTSCYFLSRLQLTGQTRYLSFISTSCRGLEAILPSACVFGEYLFLVAAGLSTLIEVRPSM